MKYFFSNNFIIALEILGAHHINIFLQTYFESLIIMCLGIFFKQFTFEIHVFLRCHSLNQDFENIGDVNNDLDS